jgi:hypothetical protein
MKYLVSFIGIGILLLASVELLRAHRHNNMPLDAPLNPDFEQNPPAVRELQLTTLKIPVSAGNLLVTASFEKGTVRDKYHAIMAGDQKFVFNDDGKEGDVKAGDGIYSLVIKEDIAALQKQVMKMQEEAYENGCNGELVQFINRAGVTVKYIYVKDSSLLAPGKPFRLDPTLFFKKTSVRTRTYSLMITDTLVTRDPSRTINPCAGAGTPNGAWTFEHIMTEMANTALTGVTVQDFVKNWLQTWMTPQTINSQMIATRPLIFNEYIKPWLVKSGVPAASVTTANWRTFTFNLRFAPFRLLAIVNRLDLRGNNGYGFSNAGEARMVFGLVNLTTCAPTAGTLIFEYGVNKKKCETIVSYANEWYALSGMTRGSSVYNAALQSITDQFIAANSSPSKPNGSSINQVRTNEIVFTAPWEFRQFVIGSTSRQLNPVPVSQEPKISLNAAGGMPGGITSPTLADYVNGHAAAIINNTYTVPPQYPAGEAFLGGNSRADGNNLYWDADRSIGVILTPLITNNEARHVFSLNTCLGCHNGETRTGFTHISPNSDSSIGGPKLSSFLTGMGPDADATDDDNNANGWFYVQDAARRPNGSPAIRQFNDLKRRAIDLEQLIANNCQSKFPSLRLANQLFFKPVNMTD